MDIIAKPLVCQTAGGSCVWWLSRSTGPAGPTVERANRMELLVERAVWSSGPQSPTGQSLPMGLVLRVAMGLVEGTDWGLKVWKFLWQLQVHRLWVRVLHAPFHCLYSACMRLTADSWIKSCCQTFDSFDHQFIKLARSFLAQRMLEHLTFV